MIFSSIKNQLRSVIEWTSQDANILFQLWSENGDEIKNASKLILKPGQGVVLLYEGKIQAVHSTPGIYEVRSANIPFITTLLKVMQAFESEHKVGVYFFATTEFLNQKWGTPAPIKYADPKYGFPVGLRAFGNFSFKITKPEEFFVNVVGSRPSFTIDQARQVIAERFSQQLTDLLAESGFGYLEIDRNRNELSATLNTTVAPEFDKLGFKMTDFRIENTDFDADTVNRINQIADAQAQAQAAQAVGVNYVQQQQLAAMRDAAKNQGGAAGAIFGLGAGIAGAQQMMAGVYGGGNGPGGGTAQPSVSERLKVLEQLKSQNLISEDEFNKKRLEILASV